MLSSLLAVFIGGGVGSVLRWAVSMKMNPLNAHIPLGTLMVNLIGGFIIGPAMAIFTRMTHLDPTEITDHHRVLRRPDHLLHLFAGGGVPDAGWPLRLGAGQHAAQPAGSLAMTLLAFMLVMWVNGR